jgi:hypothetical protein
MSKGIGSGTAMSKAFGGSYKMGGMEISKAAIFVAVIFSWILFSSANELKSASNGCCEKNNCGKQLLDPAIWWGSLTIGIVSTLIVGWPIIKLLIKLFLMLIEMIGSLV